MLRISVVYGEPVRVVCPIEFQIVFHSYTDNSSRMFKAEHSSNGVVTVDWLRSGEEEPVLTDYIQAGGPSELAEVPSVPGLYRVDFRIEGSPLDTRSVGVFLVRSGEVPEVGHDGYGNAGLILPDVDAMWQWQGPDASTYGIRVPLNARRVITCPGGNQLSINQEYGGVFLFDAYQRRPATGEWFHVGRVETENPNETTVVCGAGSMAWTIPVDYVRVRLPMPFASSYRVKMSVVEEPDCSYCFPCGDGSGSESRTSNFDVGDWQVFDVPIEDVDFGPGVDGCGASTGAPPSTSQPSVIGSMPVPGVGTLVIPDAETSFLPPSVPSVLKVPSGLSVDGVTGAPTISWTDVGFNLGPGLGLIPDFDGRGDLLDKYGDFLGMWRAFVSIVLVSVFCYAVFRVLAG